MQQIQTDRLADDDAGLTRAVALLQAGQTVAIPTETVYGLAADARSSEAVARIYAAKDRPRFNPLIVHVADLAMAERFARFGGQARALAQAFWPGPLTLVLPCHPEGGLSDLVTAGLDTVAIRVPAHPLAQRVLSAFDGPLAAPSANPSGRISPTTAAHVLAGLAGRIAAVLDGGPSAVGLESTILAVDPLRMLRPGGLDPDKIAAVTGDTPARDTKAKITAPGQLESHYAPNAPLRLNVVTPEPGEVHLGFGAIKGDRTLSATGDLQEAATRLFQSLHDLDAMGKPIAVAPVPDHGLGLAINDRLRRAAAPRPHDNAHQNG